MRRQPINKATTAYQFIKEQISQGKWDGERLPSAVQIAQTLAMSRSPVWSALKRLESEGWVSIVPQVGVLVQAVDGQTIQEILSARAILEGWMAFQAAQKKSEADLALAEGLLADMDRWVQSGDRMKYSEANVQFHDAILQMAQSEMIREMILLLRDRSQNARWTPILFSDRSMLASQAEHRQCLQWIRQGNAKKARQTMEAHLLRVVDLVKSHRPGPPESPAGL